MDSRAVANQLEVGELAGGGNAPAAVLDGRETNLAAVASCRQIIRPSTHARVAFVS
jgi:isoaspartyl peptidase/L-asparaginase-like protein (Ntn-hydrolase superfamily)